MSDKAQSVLKKGSVLYVRIDCKIDGKGMTNQDLEDHMTYVKNVAKERYFVGGGFLNVDGGMILFAAENLEEAQKIIRDDPVIERGLYRCDIFEWKLAVLSEDAGR